MLSVLWCGVAHAASFLDGRVLVLDSVPSPSWQRALLVVDVCVAGVWQRRARSSIKCSRQHVQLNGTVYLSIFAHVALIWYSNACKMQISSLCKKTVTSCHVFLIITAY